MKTILVVCTNPEDGTYMAFSQEDPGGTRFRGGSAADAVFNLLSNNADFGITILELETPKS